MTNWATWLYAHSLPDGWGMLDLSMRQNWSCDTTDTPSILLYCYDFWIYYRDLLYYIYYIYIHYRDILYYRDLILIKALL